MSKTKTKSTAKVVAKTPKAKGKVAIPAPIKKTRSNIASSTVRLLKAPDGDCKLPNQMWAILEALETFKNKQADVTELMTFAHKEGILTTNQSPLRIFRFYKKRFLDEGILEVVK
tara:strand:+ start:271 stop:615 length:345 start_codon:yes stop_codon:yes gene_type:complete